MDGFYLLGQRQFGRRYAHQRFTFRLGSLLVFQSMFPPHLEWTRQIPLSLGFCLELWVLELELLNLLDSYKGV